MLRERRPDAPHDGQCYLDCCAGYAPRNPLAAEAAAFLGRVERGQEVCVEGDQAEWDLVYAGDVEFVFASGWKLIVFNDCQSWDYVEGLVAPDGREIEYEDCSAPWLDQAPHLDFPNHDDWLDSPERVIHSWHPNEEARRVLRLPWPDHMTWETKRQEAEA